MTDLFDSQQTYSAQQYGMHLRCCTGQQAECYVLALSVPPNSEDAIIGTCLRSLATAWRWPRLIVETYMVIVVLHKCTNETVKGAKRAVATLASVVPRYAGVARAMGAMLGRSLGKHWLAFTDAYTVVATEWLPMQMSLGSDAVCGTVAINDCGAFLESMRRQFDATYTDVDGHQHSAKPALDEGGRAIGGVPFRRDTGFAKMDPGEREFAAFIERLVSPGRPL